MMKLGALAFAGLVSQSRAECDFFEQLDLMSWDEPKCNQFSGTWVDYKYMCIYESGKCMKTTPEGDCNFHDAKDW